MRIMAGYAAAPHSWDGLEYAGARVSWAPSCFLAEKKLLTAFLTSAVRNGTADHGIDTDIALDTPTSLVAVMLRDCNR